MDPGVSRGMKTRANGVTGGGRGGSEVGNGPRSSPWTGGQQEHGAWNLEACGAQGT